VFPASLASLAEAKPAGHRPHCLIMIGPAHRAAVGIDFLRLLFQFRSARNRRLTALLAGKVAYLVLVYKNSALFRASESALCC